MPATRKAPAKTPAKKAASTARAQTRAKAPRARSAVNPGARGPATLVLQGFTYKAPVAPTNPDDPTSPWTLGEATWLPNTPAFRLLAALSIGASWDDAARYAHLNQITGRRWNSRGAELLAERDGLDDLHRTDPPLEHLALAAFHVLAGAARTAPVVKGLETIERAAGSDWKAAVALLRILPTASEYRETSRTELTGAEGGPITVAADAGAQMLDLVRSYTPPDADAEGPSTGEPQP